jgi:plastocyanin
MKSVYKVASLGLVTLSVVALTGCTKAPETNTTSTATTVNTTTVPPVITPPTTTTVPPTGSREIEVMLDEYSFTPEIIEVAVGQEVKLTVTNTGRLAHTFTAPDLGIDLDVAGGKSATTTFTPAEGGEFELTCTSAGHEQLGMTGKIIVSNL